jgi:hypothetical protein
LDEPVTTAFGAWTDGLASRLDAWADGLASRINAWRCGVSARLGSLGAGARGFLSGSVATGLSALSTMFALLSERRR